MAARVTPEHQHAIAKLGGSSRQSARIHIGLCLIDVNDLIRQIVEGDHDVIAKAYARSQIASKLDIVLIIVVNALFRIFCSDVYSRRPASTSSQKEARKGATIRAKVKIGKIGMSVIRWLKLNVPMQKLQLTASW